jgi:hypothetical protein
VPGLSWPGPRPRRASAARWRALLVGLVELRGQLAGLGQTRGAEELETDGGVVEATGGVDAGPEVEPNLTGAHRLLGLEPRRFLEGADARAIRATEGIEPVPDEDAVGAGEGDDVADGGEGDEVQERLEQGLAAVLEPAEGAERATEGHHRLKPTPAAHSALVGYSQPGW